MPSTEINDFIAGGVGGALRLSCLDRDNTLIYF